MKYLLTTLLLLCMAMPLWAQQSVTVLSNPPPTVTTNDSVYGSTAGPAWQTFLNKSAKTFGAWNPNTQKSVINRLVGASYTNVSKSNRTITITDAWAGVDYSITFANRGWSETGTIADASGMTFQVYRATDIANVSVANDSIFFGGDKKAYIDPMRAWDANDTPLTVNHTFAYIGMQQGYPTWRVTYAIDTAGVVYPVRFDPHAVVNDGITEGVRSTSGASTFSARRDTVAGTATIAAPLVGGYIAGTAVEVFRGFTTFDLSGLTFNAGSIDSVVYKHLAGGSISIVEHFDIEIYEGTQGATVTVADFNAFDGWVAGSNPYNGTRFGFENTVNLVSGDTAYFSFNAAGIAYVSGLVGSGSVYFAVINDNDYDNDAYTDGNGQTYSFTDDGWLAFHYSDKVGITTATTLDSSRFIVVYDTTTTGLAAGDSIQTVVADGASDTTLATGWTIIGTDGLTDTVSVAWADSGMTVLARFSKVGSPYTYGIVTNTVTTLAANTAPTAGGWATTSIFAFPNQGSNRLSTQVALLCSTNAFGPRAFTTTGDTAAMADSSFNTFAAWATFDTVFSLTVFDTTMAIWAVAKNRDSLATARSVTVSDSLFGSITTTASYVDSLSVTGSSVLSAAPSWVTTLSHWLSASSSNADSAVSDTATGFSPGTAFLDTTTSGGGDIRTITPNSIIALVGNLVINNHDSTITSSADTIWSDPELTSFTFSAKITTDTSFVPTVGIGVNPGYQLFGFVDSTLAIAGSTKVWFGKTALTATPTYFDTAYFTGTAHDTIKWVRNSGHASGVSATIQLMFASGDSLTQGLR